MTLSEWVRTLRNPKDIQVAVVIHLKGTQWIKVKCECFKFTLEELYWKDFGEKEGFRARLSAGW